MTTHEDQSAINTIAAWFLRRSLAGGPRVNQSEVASEIRRRWPDVEPRDAVRLAKASMAHAKRIRSDITT